MSNAVIPGPPLPLAPIQLVIQHLELLGYQSQVDDLGVGVTHAAYPYFRVYSLSGGIAFLFSFGVTPGIIERDPAGLFRLLNDINQGCVVGRYSYSASRNQLYVSGWYPNFYDRVNFGIFFDALRRDISMAGTDFRDGVARFLQP
jgi:hypothetical protein